MKRPNYQSLRVYQLSELLCDLIWDLVSKWRDRLAKVTIGEQIVRSADSIGANIAEGSGRGSYKDNMRYVFIARGSMYETQHWLRRAFLRKLLRPEQVEKLRVILDELSPKLNAYLKSIGRSKSKVEKPK